MFVAISLVTLTIAVAFAAFGAWMILPFTGLELLLVGVSLYLLMRQVGDYEQLDVRDGRLLVTKRVGKTDERHEFQAHWAKVILRKRIALAGSTQLLIRSHGREIELATGLNDEAKGTLANDLRRVIGQAYN